VANAIFGNHSPVLVPRQDRESIRKLYCDILGGKTTKVDPERDFARLGEDFFKWNCHVLAVIDCRISLNFGRSR
jgi:hypothetical protein